MDPALRKRLVDSLKDPATMKQMTEKAFQSSLLAASTSTIRERFVRSATEISIEVIEFSTTLSPNTVIMFEGPYEIFQGHGKIDD